MNPTTSKRGARAPSGGTSSNRRTAHLSSSTASSGKGLSAASNVATRITHLGLRTMRNHATDAWPSFTLDHHSAGGDITEAAIHRGYYLFRQMIPVSAGLMDSGFPPGPLPRGRSKALVDAGGRRGRGSRIPPSCVVGRGWRRRGGLEVGVRGAGDRVW